MMGRRIEVDGALQKDMLQSILSAFGRNEAVLKPARQIDQQILRFFGWWLAQ